MDLLIASDGFLTRSVMESALAQAGVDCTTRTIHTTWPTPAFGDIDDVIEASGDVDELIAALDGCEVAFSHVFPFTERVLRASPDLRLVTICRGGPVNVNVEAATRLGILVTFAPGRNAQSTAEHTVGMILALTRNIAERHREVVGGFWRTDSYLYENSGLEIGSSTVGLLGYGAVGSIVARILQGFGATVLVYDPAAEPGHRDGMTFASDTREVLAESDIVSLHARVSPQTRHMIDADALALMKPGALLVNCARGPLVDYDAVIDALGQGRLAGAAFDCLPVEPLPRDHPLLTAPGIVFTPHIGGASRQASHLAARIGAEDIAAFAAGARPKFAMNPEVLDR
ncbi:MAG: 2-hydroxyacid dehydrogenase [Actinomycetaceae bacterium]|nr:2-hydroxyacid dehydrogenase [Actinomycetaceae bacterium]